MGYHHIEEIINNFLEAGMNKNMPCAIISKGCTKEQKVIKGNIANIVSLAKKEPLKAPVVIVIGGCVDLNLKENAFGNFENKRNYNELKIGVVGTQNFTKKFISKYGDKNRKIVDLNFFDVVSNKDLLPNLKEFTWVVFTSQNGVEQFFCKLKKENKDIRILSDLKFALIGSATADKLLEYGVYADFIPSCYDVKTLADEFLRKLGADDKILVCRAQNGSDELISLLKKNNHIFKDYKIYSTKENELKKNIIFALREEYFDLDYLVFGSAYGVESFFKNFQKVFRKNIKIVCIGKKCAQPLKNYNTDEVLIANKYNIDGIIECIEKDYNKE